MQCDHAFAQGYLCLLGYWRLGVGGKFSIVILASMLRMATVATGISLACSVYRQKGNFNTPQPKRDTEITETSEANAAKLNSGTTDPPERAVPQPTRGAATEAGQQRTTNLNGNEGLFNDAVFNTMLVLLHLAVIWAFAIHAMSAEPHMFFFAGKPAHSMSPGAGPGSSLQ